MRLHHLFAVSVSCALIFWCFTRSATAADLSLGRQIILDRGLQIQSLGFVDSTPLAPTSYSQWANANFTTFSSWYDTNSEKKLVWTMPWSRWMRTDGTNPLTNNEMNQHLDELVSLQYGDELNQDLTGSIDATTLSTMASTYASWHSLYGNNFLAHTNFGANNASKTMSASGLASYMAATNPDMLLFDAYPRHFVTLTTWYTEMQKYRVAGLAGIDGTGNKPIPYGQYLDLYRTSYSASVPEESFVRMQESVSWAFGYTFVTAFVYNKPNNATVFPALFASDGDSNPTAVLGYVAEANRQGRNLGPALTRLTSTDIRMIPGPGHDLPGGVLRWTPGAGGNSFISNITPTNSAGGSASSSYSDIFIGYFEPLLADNSAYPFADGTHFMIVNAASSGSAAGKAQWYHINFDFSSGDATAQGFDSLQILRRESGQIDVIPLTHLTGAQYFLDWNLEGGTGDLFRFWNSSLPEPGALGMVALALGALMRRRIRRQRTN